jgi:hypothetical protein
LAGITVFLKDGRENAMEITAAKKNVRWMEKRLDDTSEKNYLVNFSALFTSSLLKAKFKQEVDI